MPHIKTHCKECEQKLGRQWMKVHIWLDFFDKVKPNHHQHRHHEEGLKEIEEIWCYQARLAGELHIIADMGGIPLNREDYLKGDKTKWRSLLNP